MSAFRSILLTGLVALAAVPPVAAHPGRGIVVDSRGRVWFLDTVRDVLWRVDDGALVPVRRGVHSDRLVLVGDSAVTAEEYFDAVLHPRLERLAADSSHPRRADARGLADAPLAFLAVDRHGNAHFVLHGRVLMLAPDDSIRARAGGLTDEPPVAAGLGADGGLYVVVGNRVWGVAPTGGVFTVSDTGAYAFVSGVAVPSDTVLCVTDYAARTVHVYVGAGGSARAVGWPWYPVGLAAGPDGACYSLERKFRYGGIAGALNWARDLLGTPRVRRLGPGGEADVLVVVRRPGLFVPLLSLLVAGGALLAVWIVARRRTRAAA